MKKTISINISGLFFNIDEDAFNKLSLYLNSIKNHFEGREGQEEIIADIESRIAELLQQSLHENKQVITLQDVNMVIDTLGQPFEMDGDEESKQEQSDYKSSYSRKRLFRDPDNRKIAGVAAGLGAYFAIDPLWIRIIFLILLLGSGSGLFIYIVLWILVPEARTTAEKLQMKGAPVNVHNIEKSIKEEFEKVESKLNEYAKEAKSGFQRAGREAGNLSRRSTDPIIQVLRFIARVVSVIVGLFFLVLGLSLILVAGSFFLGWDGHYLVHDMEIPFIFTENLFPLIIENPLSLSLAPAALGGLIAIPLIMLIYGGLRLMFGQVFHLPGLSNIATGLWIACVVAVFYIGTTIAIDFRETYKYESFQVSIPATSTDTLIISLDNSHEIRYKNNMQLGDMYFEMKKNDPAAYVYPMFYTELSTNEQAYITTNFSAKGSNVEKARERAENITFLLDLDQHNIYFPGWFVVNSDQNLRGQQVVTRMYLPEGQIVYYDKSTKKYFDNHPRYSVRNKKYGDRYWIMTKKGLEPYETGKHNLK